MKRNNYNNKYSETSTVGQVTRSIRSRARCRPLATKTRFRWFDRKPTKLGSPSVRWPYTKKLDT